MEVGASLAARMKREFNLLAIDPPFGIAAWPSSLHGIHAQILGPKDTPYVGGVFHVEVLIPNRYPFEPPKVKFQTKIYHPNIGEEGRICLDTLNMPPKGGWTPGLNISSVLTMVRQLLCTPNPEDGLLVDVTREYKFDRALFDRTAAQWTQKYAMDNTSSSISSSSSSKDNNNNNNKEDVKVSNGQSSVEILSSSSISENNKRVKMDNSNIVSSDDEPSDDEPSDNDNNSNKKIKI